MGLGVENPFIERQLAVSESQIRVFQRLGKEEGLLSVVIALE
jgi:hypothetical protein